MHNIFSSVFPLVHLHSGHASAAAATNLLPSTVEQVQPDEFEDALEGFHRVIVQLLQEENLCAIDRDVANVHIAAVAVVLMFISM